MNAETLMGIGFKIVVVGLLIAMVGFAAVLIASILEK